MPSAPKERHAQVLRLEKGAPIYIEGDRAAAWHAVDQGVVRTCRYFSDGTRQITGFHFPGDVFGLDEGLRVDTAETVTPVRLRCLAHARREPSFSDQYDTAHWTALANANRSIAVLGRRTAPQRVAAFILMIAERNGKHDLVELPMGRTDIADYLGLTMHTVSRAMSQLCENKLISLHGPSQCRILDLIGLRALAGRDAEAAGRPHSAGVAAVLRGRLGDVNPPP